MGMFSECVRPHLKSFAIFCVPLLLVLGVTLLPSLAVFGEAARQGNWGNRFLIMWLTAAFFVLPLWGFYSALGQFSSSPVRRALGAVVLVPVYFWLVGIVVTRLGGEGLRSWLSGWSGAHSLGAEDLVEILLAGLGFFLIYNLVGPSLLACIGRHFRLRRVAVS